MSYRATDFNEPAAAFGLAFRLWSWKPGCWCVSAIEPEPGERPDPERHSVIWQADRIPEARAVPHGARAMNNALRAVREARVTPKRRGTVAASGKNIPLPASAIAEISAWLAKNGDVNFVFGLGEAQPELAANDAWPGRGGGFNSLDPELEAKVERATVQAASPTPRGRKPNAEAHMVSPTPRGRKPNAEAHSAPSDATVEQALRILEEKEAVGRWLGRVAGDLTATVADLITYVERRTAQQPGRPVTELYLAIERFEDGAHALVDEALHGLNPDNAEVARQAIHSGLSTIAKSIKRSPAGPARDDATVRASQRDAGRARDKYRRKRATKETK